MSGPRISLCVPAYRAEPFIRAAVDSCLAQTRPAHEIILSDDSSPDGTRAVLETYRNAPGVRIAYPPGHLGLGGHYRHVLQAATGSHVAILSSDDALHPRFLEDAAGELARRPDLGLLAFGGYRCDARMRPRERFGLSYAGVAIDAPAGFEHFLKACRYLISFTVWRRPELCALPPLPEAAAITTDWYWALAIGARQAVQLSPTRTSPGGKNTPRRCSGFWRTATCCRQNAPRPCRAGSPRRARSTDGRAVPRAKCWHKCAARATVCSPCFQPITLPI